MENKKYVFLEVGGRNCQVMTNDNICVLDGDCANCPHGKTLPEMAEIGSRALYASKYPYSSQKFEERLAKCKASRLPNRNIIEATIIIKALLGGGGK